jgi:threonine dehydrogenase-like Zn-dependent dehydrogenase
MKAAVYHGPGDIRSEEVPTPEPGPRDVLLAVDAVGICGSDLHVFRQGQFGLGPGTIMGHEFCATAVSLGDEVEGVEIGNRYTGFTISFCGECYWCRHGEGRLCPDLFYGYSGYGKPGAMAEYILIEDAQVGENLIPVPEKLSDEAGAMAEPLGTATYAVHRARPRDGNTAVVIGAGAIGLLVVQALKATADVTVVVTEVSEQRAELASRVGADVVLDARRHDLLGAVQEATGVGRYAFGDGGMADIVIDAAAAPPTFQQALDFVRSKGTVVLVGVPEEPATADISLIVHKDIRLLGVFGSSIPHGMELLEQGKVDVESLVSDRFSLDESPEAFARAIDPSSIKVMILPRAK